MEKFPATISIKPKLIKKIETLKKSKPEFKYLKISQVVHVLLEKGCDQVQNAPVV